MRISSHNISKVLDLGSGVRSEVHDVNGPRMLDWQEYADRVLFAALNAQNAGQQDREDELMAIARSMWDGKGLRDKVYRVKGYYETYKTALYYYMTGDEGAHRMLVSLQERDPQSN